MNPTTLVWFRQDLRLADQPALAAALAKAGPVLPVYIWGPEEEGDWPPGAASRWWLHQSLKALDADLRARGSRLVIRRGPALETLRGLVTETGAGAVHWNRRYEPAAIERDRKVKAGLLKDGIAAESFNGSLLFEPWEIETGSGGPYKVFTPFWKASMARASEIGKAAAPRRSAWSHPSRWPSSLALEELDLEPKLDWAAGFWDAWQPGEAGAAAQLKRFLRGAVQEYGDDRDRPDRVGTSRLSPHLHHGEISPRQIWAASERSKSGRGIGAFLREVGWREFAYHLLYHFPHTTTEPLRPEFARFPWRRDARALRAWQRGRTGYPLVDAGMRELWATGWMHNRVRMVVASFLVKDLMIPWQEGTRWFWDTLVDADLASNTLGWQWTAGCGADAAPFFRVFNPTSQAAKFDPAGKYVGKWVPEVDTEEYAAPVVDHGAARERALNAYQALKQPR